MIFATAILYKFSIELVHVPEWDVSVARNTIDLDKLLHTVSERIYAAQMSFEPVVGHTYYFYTRKDGSDVLSMIAPNEWGRKFPFERCLATVRMMADHTWDVQYHESNYSTADEE